MILIILLVIYSFSNISSKSSALEEYMYIEREYIRKGEI